MSDLLPAAIGEIQSALERTDANAIHAATALIEACKFGVIMGFGCGREGLQMQGFIMRLHHLGLNVSMQGDMAAPPLGKGDLLIVSAGPGELSTVRALMEQAKAGAASVLLLTAVKDAPLTELADHALYIPATTMANDQNTRTILPMGSIYEGALFMLFELMVLELRSLLNETTETMRARHTNME